MAAARAGLVLLGLGQGAAALFGLLDPRSFFDDFPVGGADWVSSLPPYNEHLVRDYGASFLAIAVLALIAARLADRRLMRVALVVWVVAAVPHLVFHLAHAERPGGASGVVDLVLLGLNALLPLCLLLSIPKEVGPDGTHP